MVQESQEENSPPRYGIVFHPLARKDMADINVGWHESIYDAIEHKLGIAPTLLGEILKHSKHLLWRAKFSKVRIVYTIVETSREIIVLSVEKRDSVYKLSHLDRLRRVAEQIRRASRGGSK